MVKLLELSIKMSKINHEKKNKQDLLTRKASVGNFGANKFLNEKNAKKKKSKQKSHARKKHVDMQSKFDSKCDSCQDKIIKGKWIKWYPDIKTVLHKHCKLSEEKKRELNVLDPNRPPSKPPKR